MLTAPEPFCIIVDTREQTPLPFPPSVPTERGTLKQGDYSVKGYEDSFAVERKSLEDLIGSLIGKKELVDGTIRYNRDRLREEFERLRGYDFRYVCVTAPRMAIETHSYRSMIDPQNVIGMICSLESCTGMQFKFFASAREAAKWVALEALHYWRFRNGLSSMVPRPRKPRPPKVPKPPKKPRKKRARRLKCPEPPPFMLKHSQR